MNRMKKLIIAVMLVICLISANVYAAGDFNDNETPFLPIFGGQGDIEDVNPPIPPSNDNTGDNTGDSTGDSTGDNTGTGTGTGSSTGTGTGTIITGNGTGTGTGSGSSGSSGGSSYKPTTKPEDTTEPEQEPTPTPKPVKNFLDVNEENWFYADVMYVYDNGIMAGMSENEFSPDVTLNRAMMITILHRISKDDGVYAKGIFSDVEANSWYENAVNWGFENRIVSGMGENSFAPMNHLTREQLCVMLYNYTRHVGTTAAHADISSYSDSSTVSDWAKDAVSWAVQEKIITGRGDNTLAPKDSATRAEAAAVIRRYIEKFTTTEEY